MKLSILVRCFEDCGDRQAEVRIAHEAKPGETVEDLAKRLLFWNDRPQYVDTIEIRLVRES